jgi:5'-deoxynucleotidase YfbR-like HD superfamily hydrolase
MKNMITEQPGRFIQILNSLQNFPRWDDFAPRFEDNTATHSWRCGVYALIAALIEKNYFGKEVDLLKVVCRAIYHDMKVFKTGPINYETKNDPDVATHIKRIEDFGKEEYISFLPEEMQETFRDFILYSDCDSIESQIVKAIDTFDAMMFCKREIEFGSNYFFKEKYDELALLLTHHPLESIRWMMKHVDEQTPFFEFLFGVLGLDRVKRWKGRYNLIADNDSTHSFRTTGLAIFNAYVEKILYGIDLNVLAVVCGALLHDLVERITGDVRGPVKRSSPETKEAFERYEKKVSTSLCAMVPDFMVKEMKQFMVHAKNSSYEGIMVDIADKLDALVKTNMERKINPFGYEVFFRRDLRSIQVKYKNPSVVYFLAYILLDLEVDYSE